MRWSVGDGFGSDAGDTLAPSPSLESLRHKTPGVEGPSQEGTAARLRPSTSSRGPELPTQVLGSPGHSACPREEARRLKKPASPAAAMQERPRGRRRSTAPQWSALETGSMWSEGSAVLALHLDGREVRFELPRNVVALASEGCGVWVLLTEPVRPASDWVYGLHPGPWSGLSFRALTMVISPRSVDQLTMSVARRLPDAHRDDEQTSPLGARLRGGARPRL